MKIFLALCLVASALAFDDALKEVLKSPKETLQLYNGFKSQQHLSYAVNEDRMRFRIFRKNAEFVAAANSELDTARYGLNFFSSMTEGEKQQYLGLNATGQASNADYVHSVAAGFQAPAKKLWVNEGAVTAVKSQGSCGSCWTFAAVGGLETRYQQSSGKLRDFSEQEYLDCVKEGYGNGCKGGWPDNAYSWSKNNGGRLASSKNFPYAGKDRACKASSTPDAMISDKITGYVSVGATEAANIEALATGSLSVAFEVTNYFQQYKGGILRDTTCTGRINHGVTAVGYTANFVLVKNSWGAVWGDKGYVKFARNHGNCELFKHASYPSFQSTGVADNTPSDAATDYTPTEDNNVDPPSPTDDPSCTDKAVNCVADDHCGYDFSEKYCAKTCKFCDEKACPSGTVRCDDGVCRHKHMC